jgi:hypothetical protein
MSCFEDIARKSNFAVIVVTLQNYYVHPNGSGEARINSRKQRHYRALRTLYEHLIRNLWLIVSNRLSRSRASSGEPNQEVRKVTTVMTLLCLAGIAFSLRFFVALCKEQRSNPHKQLSQRRENGLKAGCPAVPLDNTNRF